MMPIMFFGNALHVDLSASKTEEVQLDNSIFKEKIGGAAVIASMLDEISGECLAIGVGPLTGTTCPAGSAAIACVKDGDGKKRFAPILLNGGLELRLAGFDFILIKGASKEPAYLWIRDQSADLVPFTKYLGNDTWKICSKIRKDQGDPRIQVISSSEGDHASLNFSSGWDGIAFGENMRRMNLRAIAFRGMADVELRRPETFLEFSSSMMKKAQTSIKGDTGTSSLIENSSGKLFGLKRTRACFSCPFPCVSYAESGDPSFPQFPVLDQRSVSSMISQGIPPESVFKLLSADHRRGIEKDAIVKSFDTITDGIAESESIAAAYILGLCPRYVGLFNPNLDQYCELLSIGTGDEVRKEKVIKIAESLLRA